jgi:hypothetical protein
MQNLKRLGLALLAGALVLTLLLASHSDVSAVAYQSASSQANPAKATDTPPLAPWVEERIKLVEQGLIKSAPPLKAREALLFLVELKARIENILSRGRTHQAFAAKEPATLDEFEQVFWSMHVLSNQLTSAGRFLDHAQELKPTAQKFQPKSKEATDLSVLQTDWASLRTELTGLRDKLTLRDRNLRIARLALAEKLLTDSKDLGERLTAALSLEMDGEALRSTLTKDTTFPIEEARRIKGMMDRARAAAGPNLLLKSRLLFTGLHWWLRGRYGLGTAGGGLMKDAVALRSPDAMFGLMMPITLPKPTAPTAREPVPLVDRRHHYLWQFETRRFTTGGSQSSTTTKEFVNQGTTVTTTSYFY